MNNNQPKAVSSDESAPLAHAAVAVFKITGDLPGGDTGTIYVKEYAHVAGVLELLYGENREYIHEHVGESLTIEVEWMNAAEFEALEPYEP